VSSSDVTFIAKFVKISDTACNLKTGTQIQFCDVKNLPSFLKQQN